MSRILAQSKKNPKKIQTIDKKNNKFLHIQKKGSAVTNIYAEN
jgi:hypothetical protein